MSGEIFTQMENLGDFENAAKRNPLWCYLCNEQFEDPRILPCFHSFCLKCLRSRATEGKIFCPLCGGTSQLKDDPALPPSDSLLKFLIESSSEDKAVCANCDTDTDHGHMFFCNTCSQPLCGRCREETHKAKMFSSHEIVLMSKRTKDIHKLCKLHEEPYIMFSTEKKVMLCINCFRDMKIESRSHCVDLETAYKQGCKKLDQAVVAVHDLQNSVRDGILLLRVLLEEVRRNAVSEKQAIETLYVNIQDKVLEKKTQLEEEVERQYKAKESLFKGHLVSLTTLLPTIHVNLVTSAAFTGSANKHEFLDLAYSLMSRLTSIVQHHHHLHPNQSSQINSDYKAQIAKCLEPLLFPYYNKGENCSSSLPLSRPSTNQPGAMPNIRLELPTTTPSTGNTGSAGGVTVVSYGPTGGRRGNNNASKVKFIDAKGVFAEHCVEFDNNHRDMLQKLEKLKSRVQELHRDLTLRRTLAKNCKVSEFKVLVSDVDEQLLQHCEYLDQKRIALEKHWEESLQRIGNEQELYQAQMSDVLRLKQECQHLKTIVTQLCPFVESISKVTERIVPKLGDFSSGSSRNHQIHALFEQINTMQPDSEQRVHAIKSVEEEREIQSANRTNPLDDELIKTKGLLRAPAARRDGAGKKEAKDCPSSESTGQQGSKNCPAEPSTQTVVGVTPDVGKQNGTSDPNDLTDDLISTVLVKSNPISGASLSDDVKSPSTEKYHSVMSPVNPLQSNPCTTHSYLTAPHVNSNLAIISVNSNLTDSSSHSNLCTTAMSGNLVNNSTPNLTGSSSHSNLCSTAVSGNLLNTSTPNLLNTSVNCNMSASPCQGYLTNDSTHGNPEDGKDPWSSNVNTMVSVTAILRPIGECTSSWSNSTGPQGCKVSERAITSNEVGDFEQAILSNGAGDFEQAIPSNGAGDFQQAILSNGSGNFEPAILSNGAGDFEQAIISNEVGDFEQANLSNGAGDFEQAILSNGAGDFQQAILSNGSGDFQQAILSKGAGDFEQAILINGAGVFEQAIKSNGAGDFKATNLPNSQDDKTLFNKGQSLEVNKRNHPRANIACKEPEFYKRASQATKLNGDMSLGINRDMGLGINGEFGLGFNRELDVGWSINGADLFKEGRPSPSVFEAMTSPDEALLKVQKNGVPLSNLPAEEFISKVVKNGPSDLISNS